MQKVPNTKDFKFDQFEKYQINEILNQINVKKYQIRLLTRCTEL